MCVDTQDIQVIKIELHNTREAVLTTVELANNELKLYTDWIKQKRNGTEINCSQDSRNCG